MELIIKYMLILICIGVLYRLISSLLKRSKHRKSKQRTPKEPGKIIRMESAISAVNDSFDYSHSYKPKFLLTENEKSAYRKIKPITDELELALFTKVRLFDLIEPVQGAENYKGAMWKIQAKHVDFVVCNSCLDPKLIIELDDSTHQRPDRQARDDFVDTVVRNCGYPILHANYINPTQLREILRTEVLGEPAAK